MSSESNFSLTVKVNGELLTVRGDTAQEFQQHIQDFVTGDVISFVHAFQEAAGGQAASFPAATATGQAVQTVQSQMPGSVVVADTAPQSAPAAPASPTPQVHGAQPAAGPSCQHGPRTFREGVSKAGKPYKAWFCPSPDRNAQCAPEWVR